MADDIDMEGVDPARREETLRRIRVIQSYLSRDGSDGPTRTAAASMIGVSPNRFDALVREWTLHQKPSLMPGAGYTPPRWYRPSPERQRMHMILKDIIASKGDKASVKSIHDELRARWAQEGLNPIAISRTYALVGEHGAACVDGSPEYTAG